MRLTRFDPQDYSRGDQFTDDGAAARAEAKGCYVETPAPDELQLDLDNGVDAFEAQHRLLIDLKLIPDSGYLVRRSKSGNRHVTIRIGEDLTPERRILLQALLGSDLKREALSLKGLLAGQEHPTVLFRPRQ